MLLFGGLWTSHLVSIKPWHTVTFCEISGCNQLWAWWCGGRMPTCTVCPHKILVIQWEHSRRKGTTYESQHEVNISALLVFRATWCGHMFEFACAVCMCTTYLNRCICICCICHIFVPMRTVSRIFTQCHAVWFVQYMYNICINYVFGM